MQILPTRHRIMHLRHNRCDPSGELLATGAGAGNVLAREESNGGCITQNGSHARRDESMSAPSPRVTTTRHSSEAQAIPPCPHRVADFEDRPFVRERGNSTTRLLPGCAVLVALTALHARQSAARRCPNSASFA
jgi:hypothetical protein